MNVLVLGAGGLGSYLGALLARAGHDVTLVARGEHRGAIEAGGLRVRSFEGDFDVRLRCVADASEAGDADLAVLAVKTFSLDDVAPQLVGLADRGAAVLSVLNGVDASARLRGHRVRAEGIVDGVAYMTAFRIAPGVVERRAAHQRLVIGPREHAPATEAVQRAFEGTGVQVVAADRIDVELWEKMAVVCSLSVICAVGGGSMGSLRSHPFGADLQRQAIAEVLAVGRAAGVPVPADAEVRVGRALDAFPDDFFPSVIHDLNSGRRTEMEDLGGAVSRLGREAGVPTPLHDAGTCRVQLGERSD